MSNIEDTKPIDALAARVWAGDRWSHPHIERMVAEMSDLRSKLRRAVEVVKGCERAGYALAPVCPMCRANPWEMAPHNPTCPLAAVLKENP